VALALPIIPTKHYIGNQRQLAFFAPSALYILWCHVVIVDVVAIEIAVLDPCSRLLH